MTARPMLAALSKYETRSSVYHMELRKLQGAGPSLHAEIAS
jgi:hypothetical protein